MDGNKGKMISSLTTKVNISLNRFDFLVCFAGKKCQAKFLIKTQSTIFWSLDVS